MNETRQPTSTSPAWLPEARRQLAGLGLPPEWPEDSIEAPSLRASKSADCTLRHLAEIGLEPAWLLPSPEGGVCIAFATEGRSADIQFLNSGDIVTSNSAEPGKVFRVLPVGPGLRTAFETIRALLAGP